MFPHTKLDWNLTRLEERLESNPDDAAARLEHAVACLSKARFHDGGEVWFNRALTQARRILQGDPTSPGAHVVAGLSLVGLDRMEPATRYLEEALRLGPERADVHYALGALHRDTDRHAAVRDLEMACRLAPESWEAHHLLGQVLTWRADELGAQGDGPGRRLLERAQFHTVKALQLGPSPALTGILLDELGVSCMRTGRYDDALKLFSRLQEYDRYRDRARYYLGLVAYHLGKYKNAILHLRRHMEAGSETAHVHARIGMAYLHLHEVGKAREACHRALAIDPADLQARWTLGCAFLEEGHLDEAVRTFKEILADAPDHVPAFTELVRIRQAEGDSGWLLKALRAEISGHDRLPVRARREPLYTGRDGVEVRPRRVTRDRVKVLLRALAELDVDTSADVVACGDLTTEEGLRFQVWEAGLAQMASRRARGLAGALREPGRHFGSKLGREVLTVAQFLPEPLLTTGLQIDEEDLKRAAVDRHGPARDVGSHRQNIDRERQEARAWQALLLLAIASRTTRTGRNLLVRWASDADPELADAARSGLLLMGDPSAVEPLRERAERRGSTSLLDAVLANVQPPEATVHPRAVSDDDSLHCTCCGRRSTETEHLMAGRDAVLCNHCMLDIARARRELATNDPELQCALSGRTVADARALYVYRGVPVSAEVVDQSLGRTEREEVDQYLATL